MLEIRHGGGSRCRRGGHRWLLYCVLAVVGAWTMCLVAVYIGCCEEGRVVRHTDYKVWTSKVEFYGRGGAQSAQSPWSYRGREGETTRGTQGSHLHPSCVFPDFHGRNGSEFLTRCCTRLLLLLWCEIEAKCWKAVDGFQSAAVGTGRLYPDNWDISPIECLLKHTPVKHVQLFSQQDDWFRDSIGPTSLPGPVTSLPHAIASLPDDGSTHKWLVILEGGQRAVFKPRWYAYNASLSDWYLGYELHTSEILAFHLDRILGFLRYPVTVERHFHVQTEVIEHASPTLRDYFSRKGNGEWCLRDKCYFCTSEEETCSENGFLQGSLSYYIPGNITQVQHPWNIREYRRHLQHGFNNKTHCELVRKNHPLFLEPARFLDLVDMNILDYLSYHFDSKYYVLGRGQDTRDVTLHLDRGRAFTRHNFDDHSNMLSLWQCCMVRHTTWDRLRSLQQKKLSAEMRTSIQTYEKMLQGLPVSLFEALDRRLVFLIETVSRCIEQNGEDSVLL